MGRPNNIPITIPPVVRVGDPPTAIWANQVRTALDRLKNRGTIDPTYPVTSSYVHPYKIFVNWDGTAYTMQMQVGRFTTMRMGSIAGVGTLFTDEQTLAYYQSAGAFRGDDFDTNTLGEMTLSPSTIYGVWVTSGVSLTTGYGNPVGASTRQFDKVDDYRAGGATVRISSTYTAYTDAVTYANSLVSGTYGNTVYYIGRIETFTDGSYTVKQWRKSDICVGNMGLPNDIHIVSTDASNSITVGSDLGAYYDAPPTISADANNSISVGTDGGPYYDAP